MTSFLRNCLFFTSFSILTSLFGKFLLHLDINKRTYNHVSGECGVIPNLPGILSQSTTTGGRLYMTVNSKEETDGKTHLFTFYSDNRTAREITIINAKNKLHLQPGPISATADSSNPTIFVKNEKTQNVEIFETNDQSDAWKHLKSLKNPDYEEILDISASGPNSFHYVKSGKFLSLSSGQVMYSKGSKNLHVSYISSPTGIAYDELKKTVYVTSFDENSIVALKMKHGSTVVQEKHHDIGCSPTSIWKDFDGSFLVTCQPVRFRYLLKLYDFVPSSPSMVLRVVVPNDDNKKISITQLYSNDGATISTANIAVRSGRSLLISDGQKILNCHL